MDAVVFTSYNATANAAQQQMVAELAATGVPVIVIATRNPYDISVFPDADAVVNSYGWNLVNFQGVVRVLLGDINPAGRLPVDIPTADGESILLPLGFGLSYAGAPQHAGPPANAGPKDGSDAPDHAGPPENAGPAEGNQHASGPKG